ncbi:MAG: hypothetical protein R3264_02490, partial [Anaerolineae bacterium]|nr:hypothetical protein [Anaerolineae bacterium]
MAVVLILLTLTILSACGDAEANLPPVEEEQIENVVKSYVVREESLPEYEVSIDAVENGWARVSL